jgi:Chaperone of endosialidase
MKIKNMTTLHLRKSTGRLPLRLGFLLIPLVLICFALSQRAQGVVPPPPGGYPNFTTVAGDHALQALTLGVGNTAIITFSLFSVTAGSFNTAVGAGALDLNTADSNTATGAAALLFNTIGTENTANGTAALEFTDSGSFNTADGAFALFSNTTGTNNTAVGDGALQNNTTGFQNTATGVHALTSNTDGVFNVANGQSALSNNTTGFDNTANGAYALSNNTIGTDNTSDGFQALFNNTTGNFNIAVGDNAGTDQTTGSSNIYIGDTGAAGESNRIEIGARPTPGNAAYTFCAIGGIYNASTFGTGLPVYCFGDGQLSTQSSSRRFKDGIKPMGQASEAILALKPVAFHYKKDPSTSQFGLVAEEVEKVNPDLIVRDKEGKPYGVRYDQVNAMLLNEFLKEHRTVQEQGQELQKQAATIAKQQKQIEALTAGLQKVSAQLEVSKPAPQTALNKQ